MNRINRQNAQSTLEYILVLTAIVGFIIFAAKTWINPAVTTTLTNANQVIQDAADKINEE